MRIFSLMIGNICAVKWSNYILDGVALLLIIGYTIVCAKRGFVECFFGFVSVTVSLILAITFAKGVVSVTGDLFGLRGVLENSFTKSFSKVNGFTVVVSEEGLEGALEEQNMPAILINLVMKWFGSGADFPAGTTVAMVLAQTCSRLLCLLIAGIAIFLVSFIVLLCLRKLLSALVKSIHLLGFVNALLGAAVGVLQALLIIYAVLAVVALVPTAAVEGYLSDSLFLGVLYENNLLIKCLGLLL